MLSSMFIANFVWSFLSVFVCKCVCHWFFPFTPISFSYYYNSYFLVSSWFQGNKLRSFTFCQSYIRSDKILFRFSSRSKYLNAFKRYSVVLIPFPTTFLWNIVYYRSSSCDFGAFREKQNFRRVSLLIIINANESEREGRRN